MWLSAILVFFVYAFLPAWFIGSNLGFKRIGTFYFFYWVWIYSVALVGLLAVFLSVGIFDIASSAKWIAYFGSNTGNMFDQFTHFIKDYESNNLVVLGAYILAGVPHILVWETLKASFSINFGLMGLPWIYAVYRVTDYFLMVLGNFYRAYDRIEAEDRAQ